MKTLGQFLEEAKATYCGRCGTRHVPPSKGGTCPALKEGSMPTADEPTEHDKKMAQKVRDLLAKEKKPKKMTEEAAEDKHFAKQSPKMQDAINLHLRRGLDYLGAVKAARKHVKEEIEQIDELSKKTLGNYAYKAATDIGQHGITAGLKIADNEPTQQHFKKMGNRQKGIAMAAKKLTNEETDNSIRLAKVMHKGQHVANVITYRGRGGSWVSGAETPDGQNATKKYGIGLIDTKKEIVKKIKQYHKENNQ